MKEKKLKKENHDVNQSLMISELVFTSFHVVDEKKDIKFFVFLDKTYIESSMMIK